MLHRHQANPILTHQDVPFPSTCVFNAGVTKWEGRYLMIFRNDVGTWGSNSFHTTNLGLATSDDGIKWSVASAPIFPNHNEEILRTYDPRLMVIEGRLFMCYAIDTKHGLLGGIASTDDLDHWTIHHTTTPDNRNMVLFSERISGDYVRLERPMPVYSRGRDRFDIWLGRSNDLRRWGDFQLVAGVEDFPYANDKIGPGAPPVRTERGWLCVVHAVDRDESRGKNGWEDRWQKRYQAGLMLLDLADPSKVLGILQTPLLAPETPYEVDEGYRTNVIFPTGVVLEPSGELKVYYGAADTCVALATAHVDDLVNACLG